MTDPAVTYASYLKIDELLTLPQARRRFSADAAICAAVLSVLVEAGVLSRTSEGQYVRSTPRTPGREAA